ncbi:multicopper oxidase family protein [Kitasatospora viridis]|uniref:Multicopper oxidase CueO n=1 Tax=Kitasatospora viridis TaxID=281105 RepID=A0A561UCE6_9ACTN|nr:multicopper oxidase family protein [Kitasatospora viridis]TWF97026.1 spore coat protein A [Kitasatospora viridis]
MSPSRRQLLGWAASAVVLSPLAAACSSSGAGGGPKLLKSALPLPQPFQVPLPIPPVMKPTRTDGGTDYYDLTVRPADVEIIPGHKTTIWGYDGRFPGPTFEARSGRRAVVRQTNALSVPIVTHLHGGRTAPESDGYPTDLVLPGGDMAGMAGMSSAAPSMPGMPKDPRASVVTGVRNYEYPHEQRAATLWYHDHRMDFSAPQVWRGLAGMHLIRDDVEAGLGLPDGDRELPLLICDRSFEADGSFRYPAKDPTLLKTPGVDGAYRGGVLGDVILVNGAPWPVVDVSATTYRLRLLNASNAREYTLALDPPPSGGQAFQQIGGDGGLLPAPIAHDSIDIAPAERFDVVVDFSRYRVGTLVTLVNRKDTGGPGSVMRFHVAKDGPTPAPLPAKLAGDFERLAPPSGGVTRNFDFTSGLVGGVMGWVVNGKGFDPNRSDADPTMGVVETWKLKSDLRHPIHVHLGNFQVLSRGSGGPGASDAGWKDTVLVRDGETVTVAIRFDGYRGRYMLHCHNLEHEDMAMMANIEVR